MQDETVEDTLHALVHDGRIDDVRSISPDEVALFRSVAEDGAMWVPVSGLQGHPDMIYFLLGNVS